MRLVALGGYHNPTTTNVPENLESWMVLGFAGENVPGVSYGRHDQAFSFASSLCQDDMILCQFYSLIDALLGGL